MREAKNIPIVATLAHGRMLEVHFQILVHGVPYIGMYVCYREVDCLVWYNNDGLLMTMLMVSASRPAIWTQFSQDVVSDKWIWTKDMILLEKVMWVAVGPRAFSFIYIQTHNYTYTCICICVLRAFVTGNFVSLYLLWFCASSCVSSKKNVCLSVCVRVYISVHMSSQFLSFLFLL